MERVGHLRLILYSGRRVVIATISIVEAHCAIRGLQVTEIRNRYVSVLIHLIKGLTDGITAPNISSQTRVPQHQYVYERSAIGSTRSRLDVAAACFVQS